MNFLVKPLKTECVLKFYSTSCFCGCQGGFTPLPKPFHDGFGQNI